MLFLRNKTIKNYSFILRFWLLIIIIIIVNYPVSYPPNLTQLNLTFLIADGLIY
jgi:hypothetical protein